MSNTVPVFHAMYNKFCKVQQVEQVFTLIAWRKVFYWIYCTIAIPYIHQRTCRCFITIRINDALKNLHKYNNIYSRHIHKCLRWPLTVHILTVVTSIMSLFLCCFSSIIRHELHLSALRSSLTILYNCKDIIQVQVILPSVVPLPLDIFVILFLCVNGLYPDQPNLLNI